MWRALYERNAAALLSPRSNWSVDTPHWRPIFLMESLPVVVRFGRLHEEDESTGQASSTVDTHLPIDVNSGIELLHAEDACLATRIEHLELTEWERNLLATSVRKMNDVGMWADIYAVRSSRVFATQVMCSLGVPLCIMVIGAGSGLADFLFRFVAISMSVIGTASRVVEDAYDWRAQAAIRQRTFERMQALFERFCSLSGDLFDQDQDAAAPVAEDHAAVSALSNGSKSAGRARAQPATDGSNACTCVVAASASPAHSPQKKATAGDEFARAQHSGLNFHTYAVEFRALEESCSGQLSERGQG